MTLEDLKREDDRNSLDNFFSKEKYCPNCKQNVTLTQDWGKNIFCGLLSFILLLIFFGLWGLIIWVFVLIFWMTFPFWDICPICKTPSNKMLSKK